MALLTTALLPWLCYSLRLYFYFYSSSVLLLVSMHSVCTLYALCMHSVCTLYALCLHEVEEGVEQGLLGPRSEGLEVMKHEEHRLGLLRGRVRGEGEW